ncbi:calcium-dependent phosphotriesterase [Lichtheimia hyalospora FSU 10163]|nr:calcium-dependent phosphotriesterase [Lichtheimia hyalospora FSU 10163]
MGYSLALWVVAAALLFSHLYPWIHLTGYLVAIQPTDHKRCQKIEGPLGFRNCEDIIIAEPGVAYTSCDPARDYDNMVMDVHRPKEREEQGHVWRIDYVSNPPTVRKIIQGSSDFHPLGMALNNNRLYIINLAHHAPASIQVFELSSDNTALHVQTIRHPFIHTPNSISFWGNDGSFFFTNDHYFINGIPKAIENYARIPLGSLGFYNATSKEAYKVMGGLLFPNGVACDKQASTVFVAETYKMVVNKYAVIQDSITGKLQVSVVDQIKVPGTAVDNVHYDGASGDLYIAGHPNGLALVNKCKHATEQENVPMPPSRIVVWHTTDNQSKIETVFEDDGTTYGSSTTGATDHKNNKLLISGLYEKGIMICDRSL